MIQALLPDDHDERLRRIERDLLDGYDEESGIQLVKYWFSITDDEPHLRFLGRIHDPLEQCKLSPMELESRRRWEACTKAKEAVLERTHIPEASWWVVQAVDKKKARLNCIDQLRQSVPADMFVPERC